MQRLQRFQRRLKIYLDASVPSAYLDNEKPERQAQTIAFWNTLPSYDVYISQTLITEIRRTPNETLRNQLLALVQPFEKLPLTEEIEQLADEYIARGIFPVRKREDALHAATATVNSLDVLVSWNFEHLVKRNTRIMVNNTNLLVGYKPLEILSPPEL